MNYQNAILSPVDQAHKVIKRAYLDINRNKRRRYRNIQKAVKLASVRGFRQSKEFFNYFSSEKQSEHLSRRLVRKLLAYVSFVEFMQLANA